jgi:hypothetical protein
MVSGGHTRNLQAALCDRTRLLLRTWVSPNNFAPFQVADKFRVAKENRS